MGMMSFSELSELVSYNAETGKFYWKPRTPDMFEDRGRSAVQLCNNWNSRFSGAETFKTKTSNGYLYSKIDRVMYLAHRTAWAMHNGEFPVDQIDHINGDKSDNRIKNLRHVCNAENHKNRKMPSSNTSGFMGVSWHAKTRRWQAHIMVNQKSINLGIYDEKSDAVLARMSAEARYGFHQNHGRA